MVGGACCRGGLHGDSLKRAISTRLQLDGRGRSDGGQGKTRDRLGVLRRLPGREAQQIVDDLLSGAVLLCTIKRGWLGSVSSSNRWT